MTSNEITNLIEDIAKSFSPKMTGNELNPLIADRIRPLASTDRRALLESLREYLSFRVSPSHWTPNHAISEARMWMALDIAEYLKLNELMTDIESLLKDVKEKRALDPIDELSVSRYLERLKETVDSNKQTQGIKLS